MGRLTVKQIDALKRPGRYRAGDTLYVVVGPTGTKHWVQRIVVNGRRRDLGLGSYPITTLSEARDRAWENRKIARRGGDPAPQQVVPTFAEAAAKVEAAATWRGGRTAGNRRAAFDRYCPAILDHRVDQITRRDVLAILTPIWTERRATARQLRGWIRGVLSWALAHSHVTGNVASEIDGALPRNGSGKRHHSALAYEDVRAALQAIEASGAAPSVKACLRLIALTAVRSGEARLARWSEFDLSGRTWRIPGDRTKTGAEHRVPLSDAALAVLRSFRSGSGDDALVFPGNRPGQPIAPASMLRAFTRETGTDATVHGLRSAFRTWASERTDATRDIAEMCLGHAVGSDVERSYARSDLFDRRRRLMDQWAEFVAAV